MGQVPESVRDPEVQQEVAGRRGDMAVQRQTPRQRPVEQLSTVHVYGRGDNEPQFVDHPRLVVFAQVRTGVVAVATNFSTPLMKPANGSLSLVGQNAAHSS